MKIKKHTHHDGWVKLHRKIVQWEWWDDHNTTRLFMYLVLVANHEDAQWHGITIKKGQHLTSLNQLSKIVTLSVRQVRVALNKLILTGEVTKEATSNYTLITVNNYEMYQVNDKVDDIRVTKQRQSNDKVMTTNKKNKKEKKNENEDVLAVGQQVLNRWNEVHQTNYTSPASILANLTFWLTQYSLDDIFAAIAAIARHPYWRDKDVSPAWLFRRKNPRGEPVDYIADLIAASPGVEKVDPDLMYIPEPELPPAGKENV